MPPITIITPKDSFFGVGLGELWEYRELFYILVWRNIKIRYKQTVLGIGWVLFQPVVTTIIFSIFFGKIAKIPSDGIPYPLFSYLGLVFWNFFSASIVNASGSVVTMGSIIQKVYFPRLIIPISAVLTCSLDFVVSLIPVGFMLFYFQIVPNINLIYILPLCFMIVLTASSGLGLFLSALNVKYRDVGYVVPFFIQIGIFVTPVIYPLSVIYDYRKLLIMLNPLTGVIENFRSSVTNTGSINYSLLSISLAGALVLLIVGQMYFRHMEKVFADVV